MVNHLSERFVRPGLVDDLGTHRTRNDDRAVPILVMENPVHCPVRLQMGQTENSLRSSTSSVEDTENIGAVHPVEVLRVEVKCWLDDGLASILTRIRRREQ